MRDETTPERHAARATLYSAAAVPFLYPEEDRLASLRDEGAREGIRSAAERLDFVTDAEALLGAVEDRSVPALQSAYDDLFGLPDGDGTYPVVPYEAHYTTGDEIDTEQRRIATVVGLMEAFDIEPSDDFTERQDHVAAELELMQVVAGQRAVARHRDEPDTAGSLARAEATILAEHLVDFLPPFAHDLRNVTDDPVYLAAADLTEALVEWDHAVHPEPTAVPTGTDAVDTEVRNGV